MSTTGKIATKGCGKTGIEEDLVKRLHDQLGRKVLCVVELMSESRTENRAGDEQVTLTILTCEPVSTPEAENHLRELARLFKYDRGVDQGQLTLSDGPSTEPDLATVISAGKKFEPHTFIPVSAGENDNPICDVCGQVEDRPQHADRTKMRDPFQVIDSGNAGDEHNEDGDDGAEDWADGDSVNEEYVDEGEWDDDPDGLAGTGEAVLIDPATGEETIIQPGDPLPVIDQDEGDDLPPAYDAEDETAER